MDAYIGTIFAFSFDSKTDQSFLPCDGRLLEISQYEDLYMLIGTTYGGDGMSTFGLPNLQGRIPIGFGKTYKTIGMPIGAENARLTAVNLPPHTHPATATGVTVSTLATDNGSPQDAFLAPNIPDVGNAYVGSPAKDVIMGGSPGVTKSDGGPGNTFSTRSPYQAIKYSMCVKGTFPPRPR